MAAVIALIAMGQALHAAKIIEDLSPTSSAITAASLTDAAKRQLRITGKTDDQKDASRWRRDGFLFEAISWIAARHRDGRYHEKNKSKKNRFSLP